VAWYSKAAEQGNALAQISLGAMYENGQGVAQDYQAAVAWYRKAAEQGNADAQYNLGLKYVDGQGVAQDYQAAVTWYRKAAEQGNADAQNNLGVMYSKGQGVAQDNVVAYALFNISTANDPSSGNKAINNRSALSADMSPAQIEAAQALTRRLQAVGLTKALDMHQPSGSRE
jgi:hypothetical protein